MAEFSIINTNTWLKTEIQVPFVGIDPSFTTGSDVLLQKYRKIEATQYWDENIEYVARLPTRLVKVFVVVECLHIICFFRKPESLVVLAWGALRTRREFDAEYYEAALDKLPPNIEVRSWLKNNL